MNDRDISLVQVERGDVITILPHSEHDEVSMTEPLGELLRSRSKHVAIDYPLRVKLSEVSALHELQKFSWDSGTPPQAPRDLEE